MQKPKKIYSKRFCPQDFLVDRNSQSRYRGGVFRRTNLITFRAQYRGLNWVTRAPFPGNDPLVRVHGEIHYLTSHAPEKVQKRWNQAKIRWNKRTAWWKSGINNRL